MLVICPSKVSPRRKQSLRGWILIVCLSVWTQRAAAEVIDARVGQTATLTAPVTVNMLTSAWYRGTALTPPQAICTCFVSPPSQFNGPQYTGRETCGPDGYLVIRDILMNDTGNYTVNVQPNGAASVQATRQMRVYAQHVKVRDEVTGFVGQDVTLPCTLPIDDPSIKITQVTWVREAGGKKTIVAVYNPSFGTNLPIKHISFLQPSLTEPTLVITGLQMADEGAYTCEFATYPNGNEEGTTKLVLLAEPTNNAEAVPGVVEDQQITVANCTSANGKPPSEITWQSVIPGNISTTVTNNTSGTLTVNSQYSIFPTSAANGKTVTCVISSRTAKVPQSIPVVLSIQYPPEVSITGYDDNWYINRQQVELKCSASGNPPPTKYEWKTTNGKPLPKTVDVIGNLLVVRTVDYLVNTTFFCEASNARGTRSAQLGVFVRGDKELTAEDNTNDQQSQSPPPAHRLSEVDSKDSLDDELLAGPSHVPQTQRSHDPILPTTTSAATTTQQTPAATASTTATTTATTATATNTTRTTTTTCSNLPVPRDEEPTPTAVEGRERVHGPPVAREEVRGGRTSGRARVTTRSREEWTPSLDHFTRVVEAYQEVQGQSGQSDEFMRELIQLMRSIDNRLGQMVDLMGQQVALQRDRPVSQPPPPSSPVVPQDDSAPSSPAPTERDESPDVAGQSAGPPFKRTRGRPKKSLGVTGGTAPTTRKSRSQP